MCHPIIHFFKSLLILFASFLVFVFASFLMTLSLKLSLLKAIAKRLKSVKERQLLLSQKLEITIWEAIRKEAMNQSTKIIKKIQKNLSKEIKSDNICYCKVGWVITKFGAIEKSPYCYCNIGKLPFLKGNKDYFTFWW